jgi:hypothetical protein
MGKSTTTILQNVSLSRSSESKFDAGCIIHNDEAMDALFVHIGMPYNLGSQPSASGRISLARLDRQETVQDPRRDPNDQRKQRKND